LIVSTGDPAPAFAPSAARNYVLNFASYATLPINAVTNGEAFLNRFTLHSSAPVTVCMSSSGGNLVVNNHSWQSQGDGTDECEHCPATRNTPAGISISYEQLQDLAPQIAGPTIRILGSNTSAEITVDEPELYTSIRWLFNNSQIGTGDTLNVSSAAAPFNLIGTYLVTVEVVRDDADGSPRQYSNVVSVTVTP
jgi:hypothetical protein